MDRGGGGGGNTVANNAEAVNGPTVYETQCYNANAIGAGRAGSIKGGKIMKTKPYRH